MLYLLISVILIALSYFFFKPFWSRFNLKKIFFILFPVSILMYWIVRSFVINNEPAPFKAALELLNNDSAIMNKIGGYESYSYFEKDMPSQGDNPAMVKVSIRGPAGELYLSCKVVRDTSGNWSLVQTKEDSLVKR